MNIVKKKIIIAFIFIFGLSILCFSIFSLLGLRIAPDRIDRTPSYGNSNYGPNNCKPGHGCVLDEDEGKKKVAETPEVKALVEKYKGWEHVHIKALDIELIKHTAFIEAIYPDLAEDTGCIIIAHAGDEGYVYREDKQLNIAYQETLAEFMERTKDLDPEYMAKFYLSLH